MAVFVWSGLSQALAEREIGQAEVELKDLKGEWSMPSLREADWPWGKLRHRPGIGEPQNYWFSSASHMRNNKSIS